MKKRFVMTALALALVAVTMVAQNNRQRMSVGEMYVQRAEQLAKQLKLKKEDGEAFKLLYVDYLNARRNATNPNGEEDAKVDVKSMTDEEATEMIQKQFAGQEKQLAVDKEFLPKFLEIITPVQAAQVFVPRLGMQNANLGNMMRGMGGRMGGGMPGGFGGGPGRMPGGF